MTLGSQDAAVRGWWEEPALRPGLEEGVSLRMGCGQKGSDLWLETAGSRPVYGQEGQDEDEALSTGRAAAGLVVGAQPTQGPGPILCMLTLARRAPGEHRGFTASITPVCHNTEVSSVPGPQQLLFSFLRCKKGKLQRLKCTLTSQRDFLPHLL